MESKPPETPDPSGGEGVRRVRFAGMGVLNTRPESQAASLSEQLRQNGYEPFEVPLVELILIPEALTALSRMSPDEYDGVLLSSPNLVSLLVEAKIAALRTLLSKPWYLISNQARAQVEGLGARVAFVPHTASLDGFYKEFQPEPGLRILHICSRATRLDTKLFAEKGIAVRNLAMYAPHCPAGAAFALRAVWPRVQAVLLASGSAVHNLFAAEPELARTMGGARGPFPISIGPSVTEVLQAEEIENFRQATAADNAGLLAALNAEFQEPSGEEA